MVTPTNFLNLSGGNISVPNNSIIDLGDNDDFTLEAWIKLLKVPIQDLQMETTPREQKLYF